MSADAAALAELREKIAEVKALEARLFAKPPVAAAGPRAKAPAEAGAPRVKPEPRLETAADADAGAGVDAGAGGSAGDAENDDVIGFPGCERAPGSRPCSAEEGAAAGGEKATGAGTRRGVGEGRSGKAQKAGEGRALAAKRARGGGADEVASSPVVPARTKRRKRGGPEIPRDHEDVARWKLIENSRKKVRVSVRSFKGNVGVDIREYYEKDGKEMSAKKGYWLPAEGWPALKAAVDGIDAEIETLRRAQ